MKKNGLKIVLILSLLFNVTFMGAYGYHWYMKRDKPKYLNRSHSRSRNYFKERLNLTDEQQKQFYELRLALHDKIHPIRVSLRVERRNLAQLLMAETFDSSAIDKQLDKISSLQNDLEKQVLYHLVENKTILTTEQQTLFIHIISSQLQNESPNSRFLLGKGDHKKSKGHNKNKKQTVKEDSSCVSE